MARLKERAVIYLKADLETIHRRISNIATRGIAMGRDRTLSDIYYERARLYELYADIIIDCDNKDAEGVVESILEPRQFQSMNHIFTLVRYWAFLCQAALIQSR